VKRHRLLCLLVALGLVAAACGRSSSDKASEPSGSTATTTAANAKCAGVTLEATDTGVTDKTITVQVMADTGSPLAPGLFQGNIDAMQAYAKYINANGGIGCRQLKVEIWDSKLDATEAKNGQINACKTAVAAVGGNTLFNPDVVEMNTCADAKGQPTGMPNIAAIANDVNEQCAKNTFLIQGMPENCPADGSVPTGSRSFTSIVGQVQWYQENIEPSLVGLFLVPGDLPTTVQSATYNIAGQAQAGVNWVGSFKVSGRDEQSAFTPKVQAAKSGNVNYVYDGSNDTAMINMRREAAAQGLDSVKVWGCSVACYTDKFKAAGVDVDGSYLYLQFIPFEEKGTNAELDNYLQYNATPVSWGAQAWMGGVLFQQAVDKIVEADGPNAITRASIIKALDDFGPFDANGWMGPKNPKGGFSDCMIMMTIKGGTFERAFPDGAGTLSCDPKYLTQVTVDPLAEAAKLQ
jgi:ABC-type branched-subunit amino acid transport system substrate-binding protein